MVARENIVCFAFVHYHIVSLSVVRKSGIGGERADFNYGFLFDWAVASGDFLGLL